MKIHNKNIWVTSDTHYGHANIVKGVSKWDNKERCRPFDTIEEMNEVLVQNINSVVQENDVLIHCGDWSMGGRDNIEIFRKQLHVQEIYLIYGNHCENIRGNIKYQSLFSSTHDILTLRIEKKYIVFCHFLLATWPNLSSGALMLHGHLHSTSQTKWRKGRALDVGVDGHSDFRPYHLQEEIFPFLFEKNIESFIKNDYHTIV